MIHSDSSKKLKLIRRNIMNDVVDAGFRNTCDHPRILVLGG